MQELTSKLCEKFDRGLSSSVQEFLGLGTLSITPGSMWCDPLSNLDPLYVKQPSIHDSSKGG